MIQYNYDDEIKTTAEVITVSGSIVSDGCCCLTAGTVESTDQ